MHCHALFLDKLSYWISEFYHVLKKYLDSRWSSGIYSNTMIRNTVGSDESGWIRKAAALCGVQTFSPHGVNWSLDFFYVYLIDENLGYS